MIAGLALLGAMHKDNAGFPLGASLEFARAIEKRYLARDGRVVWGLVTVFPILDDQGRVTLLIPVIEDIAGELPVPVSIDTSKPEVMRAAVRAGATLINDVAALRRPGALAAAAALGVPVCLMHMQGEPRTMQRDPGYRDVVGEVRGFLAKRLAACQAAGIPRERLLVDPGFGFGKTLAHNLALLRGLPRLAALGVPVLVGLSRKSMIGALLGDVPVGDRLHGSVAAALLAVQQGAAIVRVHDVGPTVQALRVLAAVVGDAGG